MEALGSGKLSGTCDEVAKNINQFLDVNVGQMNFKDENNLRREIWEGLFNHLTNTDYYSIHCICLAALRILSRDKTDLKELITKDRMDVLLVKAGLKDGISEQNVPLDNTVATEALKVLCNFMFNSSKAQTLLVDTSYLHCLIKRMSSAENEMPHDMKLFDTRLLFLATALNVPTRTYVRDFLQGDNHLIEILKNISTKHRNNKEFILEGDETALACEALKVLFNLYIEPGMENSKEQDKLGKLVSILHELLLCSCTSKQDELQSHIINLLTLLPMTSYSAMIPSVQSIDCQVVYENTDMTAISILLEFLDKKLNSETNLMENISPIVTALLRLTKTERLIRKYVRLQILPPLKDIMKRPEEGTNLRAKLCKLLTTPLTGLRDVVAEFVFVLCKENVGRMVKYTGYGNAAGMFANRGLLGGRQPQTNYSSESEDSDTEEYIKYKEQINPVTGCYERPKPNPMEGMSEERKEYEAIQLVSLMDKLTREGVVQPCRIGEDGKPKPIDHVLELQTELPNQQVNRHDSDSE